jgi:hypothetical protein
MKKFNIIDVLIFAGILSIFVLIMSATSGCTHTKSAADVRNCCQRVSLHSEEMDKFGRYCKVALFLANSDNIKAIGKGVKEGAQSAVKICKFVFDVETDDELLSMSDEQHYYKVRSYILNNPSEHGWRPILDCDPAEVHCEEF